MNLTFFAIWISILFFDGALTYGLTWAATSAHFSKYRMRAPQNSPISLTERRVNAGLNNLFSIVIFGTYFYFLGGRTLYSGWPSMTGLIGEVLGVLLLYDLMHYFFHRLMHRRRLMKYCHAVHHRVRSPTSNDSAFLNPLEMVGGLGLLFISIIILGPISTVSFLVMFAIYTSVNIITHANLNIPHPAFRLFNFWVQRHNVHHHKARSNYGSIFPFWDQAFGTSDSE